MTSGKVFMSFFRLSFTPMELKYIKQYETERHMERKIILSSDSTCDLTKELRDR